MKYCHLSSHFKKALVLSLLLNLFWTPIAFGQTVTPPCNNDNIPCPTTDPCERTKTCSTPTPSPTQPPGPTPTSTPGPTPTNTPAPTAKPTVKPTIKIVEPLTSDEPTEKPTESPTPKPTETPTPTPEAKPLGRSLFAGSVSSPDQIPFSLENVLMSTFLAAFLVLLIVFPSELFNSTVQSNYDEIMRWSLIHRIKVFYEKVNHVPALIVVIGFALIGAIINSFLSPDFGFNKSTIALILGMLLALATISLVYDVSRSVYMRKRFGQKSKLRAHSLGLLTGSVLVAVSRFANFLPGYCYGIFTALVFRENPDDRQNGEGLAFASVALLVIALIGWFVWIPIKGAATANNPSFLALVMDAAFASLWVSSLTGTVFGLIPMRFMYGETIKNWNSKIWAVIYFTGVFLFVYTLLNPAIGIYGKTDKVSWIAVLSLFFGFGIFSLSFWSYFRYRAN